jgi:hypothetical protein
MTAGIATLALLPFVLVPCTEARAGSVASSVDDGEEGDSMVRVVSAGSSADTSTAIGGYKLKITSAGKDPDGFCQEQALDMDAMIRLCGDDDGCSIHLTSDSQVRAVSPTVRLVFDPTTYVYTITGIEDTPTFSGDIGDFSSAAVFEAVSPSGKPHCQFLEDSPDNDAFGFSVCHSIVPTPDEQGPNMSCTLRIED